jgi:hypothetical protein
VGQREELVIAVEAEVLERTDRHDAVDRFVELFPALQPQLLASRAVRIAGCGNRTTRVVGQESLASGRFGQ